MGDGLAGVSFGLVVVDGCGVVVLVVMVLLGLKMGRKWFAFYVMMMRARTVMVLRRMVSGMCS